MRASMRDDLKAALKARDRVAISALRSALAAIENAEALPGDHSPDTPAGDENFAGSAIGVGAADATRRTLSEADLREILETEVRDRSSAADEYDSLGRDDTATRLRAEAEILTRYL